MFFLLFVAWLLSYALSKAQVVPSGPELNLILRKIGDFDLDLIGVEDQGEEDVIYFTRRTSIQKRALEGEECKEDDCAKFTAWAPEKNEDVDSTTPEESDGNDAQSDGNIARRSWPDGPHTSSRLVKRGAAKPGKICGGTKIDGRSEAEEPIEFESYAYPEGKSVEKLGYVYDFEDFDQPNTAAWFKVKKIGSKVKGRDYAVEHILEWQMFLRFLEGKIGKTNKENEDKDNKKSKEKKRSGDNDEEDEDEEEAPTGQGFCETLHMYWTKEITFDVVQDVKQGSKWVSSSKATTLHESPIEYVGFQYPGRKSDNPYTDEFVILQSSMNTRKENIWAGHSISPSPFFSGDKPTDRKNNYKSMQFNLEHNKWWDRSEKGKEAKKGENNEGRCQGIGKFRDVLGVYQYHQDPHVIDIIKKQVERVGKAFKTMEEDVLPNQKFEDAAGDPRPKYQSLGLADKWKEFIKQETDARIAKVEEWMEKWAAVFKKMKDGDGVTNLGKMFQKRGQDYTNNCGTAADDEVIDRVKLLLEAYDKRGKWKNPFSE